MAKAGKTGGRTRSSKTRKVTLYGPLWGEAHAASFRDYIQAAMSGPARALADAINAAAPQALKHRGRGVPLKGSADCPIKTGRGQKKWVRIDMRTKATRPETKGDPPRRYGRIPYGVFVDHETGFMSATRDAHKERIKGEFKAAVWRFVETMNKSEPAPGK